MNTMNMAQGGTSSPLATDAVAGVGDAELRAVVADHWEHMMRWLPAWATTLGDHRYDAQLAPRDEGSIAAMDAERGALLARARAIDVVRLTASDVVTCELLCAKLDAEHAVARCKLQEWTIDTTQGYVLGELSQVVESHVVRTQSDARNVVARMRQGPALIDAAIAGLERGLAAGWVTSALKARRAIAMLDGELAKPAGAWAMASPAWRERFASEHAALQAAVEDRVRPAVARLRDYLRERIVPAARGEAEGLCALHGGDAMYRASVLLHVGDAGEPHALHALGLSEIARTDAELAELGGRALGARGLEATLAKLRNDRALYFSSPDEIMRSAGQALERAKEAVPACFAELPRADCLLREVPAYQAPFVTIAYYSKPHYDGSKPGEYFVNTYRPETRPRFELEALTWHEAIPGHHMQLALAQQLSALPAFRKLGGSTAFKEGWALYAEWLAEELGLYSSDLSRIGRVSFDAWRSARLVVDTGIHALGWTRAQAEAFMHEHTALTPSNIENEVDRYIGWPGQALAYKLGQHEILKLRGEAQAGLRERFDLKAFHTVVLGAGVVTLPVLAARVRAFIDSSTNL